MQAFSIVAVSNFIGNYRIDALRHALFQGLVARSGKRYPHETTIWASDPPGEPLHITRSGLSVPRIIKPSSHLIADQEFSEQIAAKANVRLTPVVFKKLVAVPVVKDDKSWTARLGNGEPEEALREQEDVPALHGNFGPYYEVQCWRLRDIVVERTDTVAVSLASGTPPLERFKEANVSPQALIEYGMANFGGGVLLSEEVFATIRPGLDEDFFLVREYAL